MHNENGGPSNLGSANNIRCEAAPAHTRRHARADSFHIDAKSHDA